MSTVASQTVDVVTAPASPMSERPRRCANERLRKAAAVVTAPTVRGRMTAAHARAMASRLAAPASSCTHVA
ncbi:MAG: hypothetical protein QGI33_05615 [Candidatus Brocadiia bacterium]|nr:hypothetical protein [Candidatus Brocadiia bacterium]